MNDVKCFGGTRAVNKLASLVRVQENGEGMCCQCGRGL